MPLRRSVADIVGAVAAAAAFSAATACAGGASVRPSTVRLPNESTTVSRFMVAVLSRTGIARMLRTVITDCA